MKNYLKTIPKIKFRGSKSTDPFSFRFYNPNEVIHGKSMKEHLRFAMSYWHTLCGTGVDMFGSGTADKSFTKKEGTLAHAKAKADTGFLLMNKLGIGFFCFHDVDIAPVGETLAETHTNLDIMADYIKEKMDSTGIKCLWGTANLFSHPRFMHGAATAPNADVFAYAAASIKKAMDITKKLDGQGYVFWGGREGYETLLNTDMKLELDNLARMMHMAVDYKKKIKFNGPFYIEPKPKEPTKHQYDFDAASTISFLRKYGLEKHFKLNIEANHATLAGHTFEHELRTAAINDMFGSIDANQGDMLLGWDTDQFPTDVYNAVYCMLEVIKAGGFTTGGLNFDAKQRRGSNTPEDTVIAYIAGMDTFALGLKIAYAIIDDGRIDDFVKERYKSYTHGIGADILNGKTDFEKLTRYALSNGEITTNTSGRQEMLESIINSIMFGNRF